MQKVNVGVVGLGAIARAHIPALQSLGEKCQIVAICDISEAAVKLWGDQLKLPEDKRYRTYQEFIKDPAMNVVDILTPNQFHRDITLAAIEAGKHVIVEKPIARTLQEADAMINAAKKNRVQLMSAHNRRYCRTFSLAKQAMAKVGEPYAASCDWRFYNPYEVTRGFRADKTLSGGGNLIDNGWHAVDLIRWLVGEVTEVFAYWSQKGLGGLSTGEDTILCIFKHQNGAISQVLNSWGPGPARSDVTIYGLNGTVVVNPETYRLYRPQPYGSEREILRRRRELGLSESTAHDVTLVERLEASPLDLGMGWAGFPEMLNAFMDAILAKKQVPIPATEGRRILQIILAAYESADKGKRVKV